MNKISEIKMNRAYILGLPILFLVIFFTLIYYYYDSSEDLSLLLYSIIIFLPLFIILSFIDGFFVKIILFENLIIKKSLFINKTIELDNIIELKVLKHQNSIIIKSKNKNLSIGWDYENHNEFKKLLIIELEKRKIPIIYKNDLW